MVKLLLCNLNVTGSSHGNNFLQSKIRLRIIDLSPGAHIGGSFVHRTALYLNGYPKTKFVTLP